MDPYHFNARERKNYPHLVALPASWRSRHIAATTKALNLKGFKVASDSNDWMFGKGSFGVRFTREEDAQKFREVVEKKS